MPDGGTTPAEVITRVLYEAVLTDQDVTQVAPAILSALAAHRYAIISTPQGDTDDQG